MYNNAITVISKNLEWLLFCFPPSISFLAPAECQTERIARGLRYELRLQQGRSKAGHVSVHIPAKLPCFSFLLYLPPETLNRWFCKDLWIHLVWTMPHVPPASAELAHAETEHIHNCFLYQRTECCIEIIGSVLCICVGFKNNQRMETLTSLSSQSWQAGSWAAASQQTMNCVRSGQVRRGWQQVSNPKPFLHLTTIFLQYFEAHARDNISRCFGTFKGCLMFIFQNLLIHLHRRRLLYVHTARYSESVLCVWFPSLTCKKCCR